MKIGLTGTVSVGKSTLVKELAKLPQFKDYHIATERSKYLRDSLNIPLNTDSTNKGQFVFIAERSIELMQENLITDRSVWDVCAFTLSASSISWEDKELLVNTFMTLRNEYDIIFYVNPYGVEIEDNGIRTIEPTYREKIDFTIRETLKEYPPRKLVEIQGSTESRIEEILKHIS
jgi:nicotinamide riboside kinase